MVPLIWGSFRMPIIRGTCANDKPIADIVLAPVISAVGCVEGVPSFANFHMTPLRALLDTGADGTSISTTVAQTHQLTNLGRRTVVGIGGPVMKRTWGVFVGFLFDQNTDFEGDNYHAKSVFAVPDAKLAVELPPNGWFDVIIGRDILTMYDFYMKRGGHWELHLS